MGQYNRELIRLREGAGFTTAYMFYHRNGGRRAFPFTYAYYIKVERGDSLPKPKWAAAILAGLRTRPSETDKFRLTRAYLMDLSEDASVFDVLFSTHLKGAEGTPHLEALKSLLGASSYNLTHKQFELIVSGAEIFWCFTALSSVSAAHTAAGLAQALALSEGKVSRALDQLVKAKLARKLAGKRYECPFDGRYCSPPADGPSQGLVEKMRAHIKDYTQRRGKTLINAGTLIRLESKAALEAAGALKEVVSTASARAVRDQGEDAAVFSIEAVVRRVVDL